MSVTSLSATLLERMTAEAEKVVDRVLLSGPLGTVKPPRGEVGFVAAITLGGVPDLAKSWSPLLAASGYVLKIDGVFCHAAPLVEYQNSTGSQIRCELADLLVVTDFMGQGRRLNRRATLIQAKMAAKASRVSLSGPSSVNQLALYTKWPSFKFVEAKYGGSSYSLGSTVYGEAASFGVIDRHFRKSDGMPPRWTQHSPDPEPHIVTKEPTLGAYLVGMVAGTSVEFGRAACPNGSDDWSTVVDLLLGITYGKTFRHKATLGGTTAPRGNTAVTHLVTQASRLYRTCMLTGQGADPPRGDFEIVYDDYPQGISVMRIEVSYAGDSAIKDSFLYNNILP